MGKRLRKPPTRQRKFAKRGGEKPRKLTEKGHAKRKKGDSKILRQYSHVGYPVKQRKGGKWVKTGGVRQCKIHTVCNCVARSDLGKQQFVTNR